MNQSTLSYLTEQAKTARDDAAKLLATERHNKQRIAQQLEMLKGYRNDYASELQRQLLDGLAPATVATFRAFLTSLEDAIERAEATLMQQDQRLDKSQSHWQQQQQKLQSFNTLQSRQSSRAMRDRIRAEQRLADEFTTNLTARRIVGAGNG